MTTLRVVLESVHRPVRSSIGRYSEEVARALIATAPDGVGVDLMVPHVTDEEQQEFATLLPGASITRMGLAGRGLRAAWLSSLTTLSGQGLVHSPSLFAPLRSLDKDANPPDQMIVTVHGLARLQRPERYTQLQRRWFERMLKRAVKYADAIVVPTHAVLEELDARFGVGSRARVVGAGVSATLHRSLDEPERAERLQLPERYVVTVSNAEDPAAMRQIIAAFGTGGATELPLVVAGSVTTGDTTIQAIAVEFGIDPGRVQVIGEVDDQDLATAYARASVFIAPDSDDAFGLTMLEASSFGVPVVHAADASTIELAGGAGVPVDFDDADQLAHAVRSIVDDAAHAERLGIAGADRAAAFSWRGAAEELWQLHADV